MFSKIGLFQFQNLILHPLNFQLVVLDGVIEPMIEQSVNLKASQIKGSVDMASELIEDLNQRIQDKELPLVVVCEEGLNVDLLEKALTEAGWEQLYLYEKGREERM